MTTEKAREGHYQAQLKIKRLSSCSGSFFPKESVKLLFKVAPTFLISRMKSR